MNLAEALYAAAGELRDGGIHEIRIEEECDLDDGGTVTLSITMRRFELDATEPESEPG